MHSQLHIDTHYHNHHPREHEPTENGKHILIQQYHQNPSISSDTQLYPQHQNLGIPIANQVLELLYLPF